jgi:hypothetical protein
MSETVLAIVVHTVTAGNTREFTCENSLLPAVCTMHCNQVWHCYFAVKSTSDATEINCICVPAKSTCVIEQLFFSDVIRIFVHNRGKLIG